jgi:hypothetical protein
MHPIRAISSEWDKLKKAPRGARFSERFDAHRNRSLAVRFVLSGLGAVLFVVGVVMLVVPGPGLLLILLGLSLGSLVLRPVAVVLDTLERAMWRSWMRLPATWRASRAVRVLAVLGVLCGAVLAGLTSLWLVHQITG